MDAPVHVHRADTAPVHIPGLIPSKGWGVIYSVGAVGLVPLMLLIGAWQWI